MVCPIMSGTIVERRDHVFNTFFSFRAFSPSTFTRRWPSTNGPFFVERAIASLFLHAAQTAPLGMPHLFKPTHRTRYTVRLRTERANKSRALRVRYAFHDHRPARLAQLVQHRFGWRDHFRHWFRDGFYRRSFYHSLHGTRPASGGTCCSCRSHGYRFLPAGRVTSSQNLRSFLVLPWALSFRIAPRPNGPALSPFPDGTTSWERKLIYLRRSTIMRSVRLFPRVFLPRVGKAQGVCG